MRRRPRRRPPTIQEIFLGFCFCILAVSIAWNILPRASLYELANGAVKDGVKTVQFPADAEPSGAVRAALAEHAARIGHGKATAAHAAAQQQSDKPKDEPVRSWGTALFGR